MRPRVTMSIALSVLAAISTLCVGGVMPVSAAGIQHANSDVGYPTFTGDSNPIPDNGVRYSPTTNYLSQVFEKDKAGGAGTDFNHDFWIDKILMRKGAQPTGTGHNDGGEYKYDGADENHYLFSRGRAAYMRTHQPGVFGFGGEIAYKDTISSNGAFTVDFFSANDKLKLQEESSKRKQTPSYWKSLFTTNDSNLSIELVKYITNDNVLVAQYHVINNGPAQTLSLSASSPLATAADGDELRGTVKSDRELTTIYPRFSGDGMTVDHNKLNGKFEIPAHGEKNGKVQLGLIARELPSSETEYKAVKAANPKEAYKSHVTSYNKWWADNIPYIQTPEANIDKTLFYRWWLSRFNFIDANMPGNTYQFPSAIEGVLGYNNSIVLTTCMFINDLKYLRDPSYAYGSWVAAGETSKSRQYIDNPGGTSWNNSYTQYITDAALQSYKVHGGPSDIASAIGMYGQNDVNALIGSKNDSFNRNGNKLIDYDWASMTGNDSDAVSFFEHEGEAMDRAESAWVWANAKAAAEAFAVAKNTEGANAMNKTAEEIRSEIIGQLWNPESKLIQHKFIGAHNGQFAKWKEINNYYPFAAGLMPSKGEKDYDDDYEQAYRLFSDADEFPLFPFFTANQKDVQARAEENPGKTYSNNFAILNSVPLLRIYAQGIRKYHTQENHYISDEMFKKLLYWNAFAHYQGGDNRYPDQNEFWNTATADKGGQIDYRSWIHHTQLGTTNWAMIEDVAGLVPREDSKIELDPISIPGWDYFTVNNLCYHGHDMSIVWDKDGSHYGVGPGFSLYVDGEPVVTTDKLSHVIYDSQTGCVSFGDHADKSAKITAHRQVKVGPADSITYPSDSRVTDIFAKAGRNIDIASRSGVDIAKGAQVKASFESENYPATAAVNGTTINEPFWGTAGSPNEKDSLQVTFDRKRAIDDLRLYFYKSAASFTVPGYSEPSIYTVEYQDSSGAWKTIPKQYRTPTVPEANYNRVQFPEISTNSIRVTFTHMPGYKTGLKEIEAFDTGIPAPKSERRGPVVDAYVSKTGSQGAELRGTVKYDGLSDGTPTTAWTQISGPGPATFSDAKNVNTSVKFNVEGDYVLRLSAFDGQNEGHKDVSVHGVPSDGLFNTALQAKASASYVNASLPKGNVNVVNDGVTSTDSGNPNLSWNNWGDPHKEKQPWLQLTWPSKVSLEKSNVYFWTDNGGVPMPEAWKLQYFDDSSVSWKDVTLNGGSSYTVKRDEANGVSFDKVQTDKLRILFNENAVVGVSEFEAYVEDPLTVSTFDIPTKVGVLPKLPATVDAAYGNGKRKKLQVQWPDISQEQVKNEGEFVLTGTVIGASHSTTAKIWVRSDTSSAFINGVEPLEQTVYRGSNKADLDLPDTVTGIYNNGVHESGQKVSWDKAEVAAIDLSRVGDYAVTGVIANAPDNVKARLTVHVVDKDAPVNLKVTFDSQGGSAIDGEWVPYGTAVTRPKDPLRADYTFKEWTLDREGKQKYDFATPVTKDLTLYAQWTRTPVPVPVPVPNGSDSVLSQTGSSVLFVGMIAFVGMLAALAMLAARRRNHRFD